MEYIISNYCDYPKEDKEIQTENNVLCLDISSLRSADSIQDMNPENILLELSVEIEAYLNNKEDDDKLYRLDKYSSIEIDGIPVSIDIGFDDDTEFSDEHLFHYNIHVKNIEFEHLDETITVFISDSFPTIKELLEDIVIAIRTYTFIDCFLLSPLEKQRAILKRSFLFSFSKKLCCVCNNPTIEETICKHSICLSCRYKCMSIGNNMCPVCKDGELKYYPDHFANILP
jgi:hypothetical protein